MNHHSETRTFTFYDTTIMIYFGGSLQTDNSEARNCSLLGHMVNTCGTCGQRFITQDKVWPIARQRTKPVLFAEMNVLGADISQARSHVTPREYTSSLHDL